VVRAVIRITILKSVEKDQRLFASLGEPPTAAYERQQAAKQKIRTNGREAYGAVNYGPYHSGGPFSGGRV